MQKREINMNESTVIERVVSTLNEILDKKDHVITPATRLKEDLGVDHLDRFELVIRCEDIFHIEISDDIADSFATVQDIAAYVVAEKNKA
jgi:acyl carrier protein